MADVKIECLGCHSLFDFKTGEQEFYASKGLAHPKRCPACRAAKKAAAVGVAPTPKPVEFISPADVPTERNRRSPGNKNKSRRHHDDD